LLDLLLDRARLVHRQRSGIHLVLTCSAGPWEGHQDRRVAERRGVAGGEIALRLDLTPEHVSVIRARFRAEGVAGFAERRKAGRTDHTVSAELQARVVEMAMSPPPAGRSRWTTRLLGKQVSLSAECVSKGLH
jgi:Homeodomain-like domain